MKYLQNLKHNVKKVWVGEGVGEVLLNRQNLLSMTKVSYLSTVPNLSLTDSAGERLFFFFKLGFTPCKAWIYKKRSTKRITGYRKSV